MFVQGGQHQGVHAHGAHAAPRRVLPPPPQTDAGRVIIRVEPRTNPLEQGAFFVNTSDRMLWKPSLDGNRGFVLKQNQDWLRRAVLDQLLTDMDAAGAGAGTEDPEASSLVPPNTGMTWFKRANMFSCAFFLVMLGFMAFVYHNPGSELLMPVMGIMMTLSVFYFGSRLASMSRAQSRMVQALNSIAQDKANFAQLWSAANGLELRYVGGQTYPDYFELTPHYEEQSGNELE